MPRLLSLVLLCALLTWLAGCTPSAPRPRGYSGSAVHNAGQPSGWEVNRGPDRTTIAFDH